MHTFIFEWDEDKRQANVEKHGVDFAEIDNFDWTSAQTQPDTRRDYGELRWLAYGLIGNRVHVVIFTMRDERRRLISLRRANRREVLVWAGKTG